MMICIPHWELMREALKLRCIDHLGAKDGPSAISNVKAEISGEIVPYDPFMSCNWMVMSRALEWGGLYLMGVKQDGSHYCPICECLVHRPDDVSLEEATKTNDNFWINGPADAALAQCQKLKLVPPRQ